MACKPVSRCKPGSLPRRDPGKAVNLLPPTWFGYAVVVMIDVARQAYRRALALSPDEPQIASALRRLEGERTGE